MNRKQWLIIKLILLVLIFSMFIGIAISAINYSKSSGMPIVEGEKQSFSDIDKIVIESISLPVHIYESDVTQVTVMDNSKAYGLGTSKPNRLSQESSTLSFKQGKRISFLSFVMGDLVIEVPRGSVLEYDIENISGSITHDARSTGTLKVSSISGSVKVHQIGDKVFAKSTSGSVRIYATFEEVSAESISGSVRVMANQDSRQILGSSVSGSVSIQLENVSGYEIDYSTTSGSVKDTYTNIDYSKSGMITQGDSILKINASSVSGSIRLMDWE